MDNMTDTIEGTPRIYVACLAAYNAGILHGSWVDATRGIGAIRAAIRAMLAASPIGGAEEWAIHDHEGFFGLAISESEGIEGVARMAGAIAEHGEPWALYAGLMGSDYAHEHFEDAYCGAFDDEEAFAMERLDEQLAAEGVPDRLALYIDHERFARDLFLGDYASSGGRDGMTHVFDCHV